MSRQQRIGLAGVLALASAAMTVWLYFTLQPDTRYVVVTTRPVEPFTVLAAADLAAVRVDAATAQRLFPGAYADPAALTGRVAVRRIAQGEVLRSSDPGLARPALVDRALRSGELPLSALVPGGYRAVAVDTGPVRAAPGDYVQLYGVQPGQVRPVLARPVQVVAAEGGSLVVLLAEGDEVDRVLAAGASGYLQAVLAPLPPPGPEGST